MGRLLILIASLLGFTGGALAATDPASAAAADTDSAPMAKDADKTSKAREASLGELLYQNHCRACHEANAHLREARKARSPEEVRGWVERWARDLKLNWSAEQVRAVQEYLQRKYYKF